MKHQLLMLLLLLPTAAACPMPMYKDGPVCCLGIGENYSTDVMSLAKTCPQPYFMKSLSCCIYEKNINYTIESYADSNGTIYTLYKGPFYGETTKKEKLNIIDPTKDPKLLEISRAQSTIPNQLKNYSVSLTNPPKQSNGSTIIAVIILLFLIILMVAWRLGKEEDEK